MPLEPPTLFSLRDDFFRNAHTTNTFCYTRVLNCDRDNLLHCCLTSAVCRSCGLPGRDHIGAKCPYAATRFVSDSRGMAEKLYVREFAAFMDWAYERLRPLDPPRRLLDDVPRNGSSL